MWIVICSIIASVFAFFLIYNKLNTKNVIEYHPNGRVKIIGVSEFNKRVGIFETFDEHGRKTCQMLYEKTGKLSIEEYFNLSTGQIWKTLIFQNGFPHFTYNLRNVPEELQVQKEFWDEVYETSSELKNERKKIMNDVKSPYFSLEKVDEHYKKDREIVLEAVKKHGRALQYAD